MPSARNSFSQWEVPRPRESLWRRLTAAQLFVGSFLLLIVLGALGLKFLPGLYTGEELGWLDAFFTATSAVCVTGLVVVDTAIYFTPAGQAWILLLIQLGGLGFITFTTLIIVALGRRLSLRHETLARTSAEFASPVDYRRLTRDIVLFTFTLEGLGALLLYLLWIPSLGIRGSAWPALFHSISAFCNAGFSTFSASLIELRESSSILVVIMLLITIGGIGFLVMEELVLLGSFRQGKRIRLSLHARLVLGTTLLLVAAGWLLFTIFEWHATLAGLPVAARLTNSLFLSITARTAGFNTVDYAAATTESNFLTILLMMIGGSPGSTAGGLKTTTVAVLGLLAWSRFRGHEVTSIWGRSIPEETIQRAFGLFAVGFGIVTIAIFLYVAAEGEGTAAALEHAGFLHYMFEAVSAFNTVGLSMGVTSELSAFGRVLTMLLMFLGRVGPLTFAAAIALRRPTPAGEFRYAYEDVVIG